MLDKKDIFQKVTKTYQQSAVIFFNVVVILVILNLLLSFITRSTNPKNELGTNRVSKHYGQTLKQAYPNLTQKEINILLDEIWNRRLVYEPFVVFKEEELSGKYVHVHSAGFRFGKNQGPWPPDSKNYNIFLFGGSTTFCYGLPDDSTISSYLQENLSKKTDSRDVYVYNFGRGYYYSTQELFLFLRLIQQGFIPDMAIFVDGFNEFDAFSDRPKFSQELTDAFRKKEDTFWNLVNRAIDKTAILRAINKAVPNPNKKKSDQQIEKDFTQKVERQKTTIINEIINRYIRNKELIQKIGDAHAIKLVFVWQPISTYYYDMSHHPFGVRVFDDVVKRKGYEQMKQFIKGHSMGKNFIWCADIQANYKEPLYVDCCHYGQKLSKLFAECISQSIILDEI